MTSTITQAMPYRLFYSSRSPFVRKVLITAIEVGKFAQIELETATVTPRKLNQAIMAYNPFVKLPTMILLTGEALYGSDVICAYLDAEAGGGLIPASGPARWAALRQQELGNGLMELSIALLQENRRGENCDRELGQSYVMRRDAALLVMQSEMKSYAAGRVTLGHVAIGCALSYLDFRMPQFKWRGLCPDLDRWFSTFSQRPSMQKTPFSD